jgi:hypothetical protein
LPVGCEHERTRSLKFSNSFSIFSQLIWEKLPNQGQHQSAKSIRLTEIPQRSILRLLQITSCHPGSATAKLSHPHGGTIWQIRADPGVRKKFMRDCLFAAVIVSEPRHYKDVMMRTRKNFH